MCSTAANDLCKAIKMKDIETVRSILLKNPEIVKPGRLRLYRPATPLWEAILSGHEEIVELLIDFGANADEPYLLKSNSWFNHTFLQCLALLGDFWQCSEKVAEVLITHGASVHANHEDVYEETALQMAIVKGNVQYTEFLLKHSPNLKDSDWKQGVLVAYAMCSPKNNHKELLQLLIHYGLDINYHNGKGQNYLQMLIICANNEFNDDDHNNQMDILGIAEVFINSGMPVNELDNDGNSAIVHALEAENIQLVSFLVKKGADVNAKSVGVECYPLYMAAASNDANAVNFFLSKGAEINAKTYEDWTALHAACNRHYEKIIRLLIQKGADISVEDDMGSTPFKFLNPDAYRETDVPSINYMLKEIAKVKFFDETAVSKTDLNLIQTHPVMQELFDSCMKELKQMLSTKFYTIYSYCSVITMSKNIKKLSNLVKNEKFIKNFEANLPAFPNYESDLKRILDEAIQLRNRVLLVESRLKAAFGNSLPDIIIRKVAENLSVEDLP